MKERLKQRLAPFGQEHLLTYWDDLDEGRREKLAAQISEIDFAALRTLREAAPAKDDFLSMLDRAKCPPAFRLDAARNRFAPEEAIARGENALRRGRIGIVLVAGGQGTRLGFDHPKGMFPIGPVSGKTLFQIHFEKILALSNRYDVRIPLFIMTSPATHDETVRFLSENGRFGLEEDCLYVFMQGTMPAVDMKTGKVLLAEKDRVFTSPDGHGGMLAAMEKHGCLDECASCGIEHLFYFQVDNPMVDIGSPEFLGYHLLSESDLTSQVIAKEDPLERVGNVVDVDGRLFVVEYSDLPDEAARRRNEDGSLAIWAGSIAVHAMSAAFLRRILHQADALPFHVAKKKVPHLDPASGEYVEPEEPNALKFERFIFDILPYAKNAVVVEIDREEGFGPLKNAPGAEVDTPESVRAQMVRQAVRRLKSAGARVREGAAVEISPLFARTAGEVLEKVPSGIEILDGTYLDENWSP